MNVYRYKDRASRSQVKDINDDDSLIDDKYHEVVCRHRDDFDDYEDEGEDDDIVVEKNNYCIVYFEVMRDLNVTIEEYLVLEQMLFRSKHNTCKIKISSLADYLCFTRASTYKYIKGLIQKRHVEKEVHSSRVFYIHHDVEDRFKPHDKKYIKIYHKKRKQLGLSPMQFSLLYMIYSLSKNLKNKYATASIDYYRSRLGISIRHYYSSLEKCERNNLIIRKNLYLKLEGNLFEWFKSKEKVDD